MIMKLTCPHCGATGSIDDKFIGRKLKCPKCSQNFRITEEEDPQKSAPESKKKPDGISPGNEEHPEQAVETESCTGCRKAFPEDELIEIEGQRICVTCKPALLQKLKEGATETGAGGLESGMAGQYSFQIGEVLSEAWEKVNGAKGAIFGAVFAMYAISFLIMRIGGMLIGLLGLNENGMILAIISQLGLQFIYTALTVILTAGIMMMGVRRAADESINFPMLFDGIAKVKPLLIAMILQTIIVIIGFLLLIIPGIYLSIAYGLTIPLIMKKGLGPWEAMEASRKAIHHSWFQVFGLYFVMGLIFMVSALPLGIGLIWTIPMGVIVLGIVYRIIFGTEE
jgi:predicted Zn finger-like uncharacterized protein